MLSKIRTPRGYQKQIIGWREWVSFPKLNIPAIKAKIDTGARTSALHAYNITPFKTSSGKKAVRFQLHPLQRSNSFVVNCKANIIDTKDVKSSNGSIQSRFTIEVLISLNGYTWPIEVTLTNRDEMGFRFLLGRTALKDLFLVDPKKSFLLSPRNGIFKNK